ncbi:electron transfer flavoprotein subunit alpha/FixB family protein [Adlercreutzia sp. ZJ138]|uniref:electron transfer flavoprotein subunit alpha/FixB family protein n=1 Tax=Adlercreutzia sp. ZJ138 TaxID=2709405 RepID=UPI0013ED488B|nr:electron transfer flavoprotein subunit alpha/FixB family protein [Adlercreutzia sp. ZJ138]
MGKKTWIIATESRRLGGIVAAARRVSDSVSIAAVGSSDLASEVASYGADRVVAFVASDDVPVEPLGPCVAEFIAADGTDIALSNDSGSARCILGAVAGAIGAAVVGNAQALSLDGDNVVADNLIANAKAIEAVSAPRMACIYTGPDDDRIEGSAAAIECAPVPSIEDRAIGFEEATGTGLATASRVVGVGMGLATRDNLPLIDALADAMGAELACTLPCCDDMRWYPSERVLGSSHNTASPDLYIAVGISGSPNHTSGFRDAKTAVAVNNDPDAEIFNCCKYGIVGDLFDVVPALTEAFK